MGAVSDRPDDTIRMEFKTVRYDRFSGARVNVPTWLPDASVGIAHMPGGKVCVYVDVSWPGGGWICSGEGASELAAANDLVLRLKRLPGSSNTEDTSPSEVPNQKDRQ